MSAPLVYITGASSGIGLALAERFLQAGYRLALAARRAGDMTAWARAQGLAAEQCMVYEADVRDIASITGAGRRCLLTQGLPDVVIANAGISEGFDTAEFEDLAVLRDILETNLIGLAATFQPFLHPLRERRAGTLVGVASVAGIRGLPGHGAYCSSKAGVISYCESLRGECRPFGLKVVTISPGFIDTPLTRRNRYPMPFLMPPEAFADSAFRAIERGASHRVIPWQMGLVARLLKVLPDALFDRAFQGRGRKPRRGE
ncbi:MAG: short-chain dehydrogenase [Burkholderiales bacterium 28-67-8]|nr:MAG: short-chain dehydrogenase [Burkholderiales bacterium 28-67-8]